MTRAALSPLVAASLMIPALVVPSLASAWAPIASGSPVWRPPVPYSLHQAGSPDLGGFGPTEAEVRRGMDDWSLVSCTSLTTSYQGSTSRVPGNYEGTSTIGWIESGWPHSGSAIGVTGPTWGSYIIEADMQMNGVNFTWTTGPGTFSNVNAYSIVLHEGGHYYGLGHSDVRGSSMWPSYGGGIIGLAADDQNGICALYPGGSGSDCTTTGCPSGQECVDRACRTVTGDGTVCSPCSDSSQCGGPGDYCLTYPDGGAYCARACRSSADCGSDVCVGTGAGPQCIRVVSGSPSCQGGGTTGCTRDSDCATDQLCDSGACVPRPTSGAPLGDACTADADCQSNLCIAGTCSRSCDWTNPGGSCPSGFYCDGDVSTSCDSGYCVRGSMGAGGQGAACSADTECASLHCDRGTCSTPCIPGGAAACPAGSACQVGSLSCRGSCRVVGALGDGCATNVDCASSLCADRGEDDFCTRLCDAGNPCPDRFTCTPVGEVSVCVPDSGGLGSECETNPDCLSDICALEGDRSYCTRICDDTAMPCPTEFMCVVTADGITRVCQPTPMGRDDGCGCRTVGVGPRGGGVLALLGVGLLGLGLRRRRR